MNTALEDARAAAALAREIGPSMDTVRALEELIEAVELAQPEFQRLRSEYADLLARADADTSMLTQARREGVAARARDGTMVYRGSEPGWMARLPAGKMLLRCDDPIEFFESPDAVFAALAAARKEQPK